MATQTRWHINREGEVGKCGARRKCPFGGESGSENHFDTQEAAELYLARNQANFSALGTKRKTRRVPLGRVKPETRNAVEDLVDAGVNVSSAKKFDDLEPNSPSTSSVDILDESLGGISLDAIRANRPF